MDSQGLTNRLIRSLTVGERVCSCTSWGMAHGTAGFTHPGLCLPLALKGQPKLIPGGDNPLHKEVPEPGEAEWPGPKQKPLATRPILGHPATRTFTGNCSMKGGCTRNCWLAQHPGLEPEAGYWEAGQLLSPQEAPQRTKGQVRLLSSKGNTTFPVECYSHRPL